MQNTLKNIGINYAMYVRKSSESEDRQALSTESQIQENLKRAKERNLTSVEKFQESKSAKQPGREEFSRMMIKIEKGELQGIICWSLDRLARNPIDGGRIMWAMQMGLLKHIQTASGDHYPGDNVLVMQVHFGMANQFIIDLSKNTKRGLRAKAEKGYPPCPSKVGFLNDYNPKKGERKLIPDPERLPLVKKMFEYFLSGKYSVRQIHMKAKGELKLTTCPRRKLGGNPLSLSRIYQVLKDPFYCGFFYYSDQKYEVSKELPRIISAGDHKLILQMMNRPDIPRPKTHTNDFAYIGRTKCYYCGGSVTAEIKNQLICPVCKKKFAYSGKDTCPRCQTKIQKMSNPKYLRYVYYHCIGKYDPSCPGKCMQEKDMDRHLWNYYDQNLTMSNPLVAWCIKELENIDKMEKGETESVLKIIEKQIKEKKNKIDKLIEMTMSGLLNNQEFSDRKSSLKDDIEKLQLELKTGKENALDGRKKAIEALSVMDEIEDIIKKGTVNEKKELLSIFGSNLKLSNEKLNVFNNNITDTLVKALAEAKAKNPDFEPKNIEDLSDSNPVFRDVRPAMLRG